MFCNIFNHLWIRYFIKITKYNNIVLFGILKSLYQLVLLVIISFMRKSLYRRIIYNYVSYPVQKFCKHLLVLLKA